MRQFFAFDFQWNVFAFHSDELCGHHKGTLSGDLTMTGNSIGDPHTRTVNGTNYDFQAVGEFTLLRDGDQMEIQVRQTPVATQNPITDSYTRSDVLREREHRGCGARRQTPDRASAGP